MSAITNKPISQLKNIMIIKTTESFVTAQKPIQILPKHDFQLKTFFGREAILRGRECASYWVYRRVLPSVPYRTVLPSRDEVLDQLVLVRYDHL
jgi:hypothetical protein